MVTFCGGIKKLSEGPYAESFTLFQPDGQYAIRTLSGGVWELLIMPPIQQHDLPEA